jgi:hypothetical protein
MNDPLLGRLEHLGRAEPDRARAERVRARCHTAMARRRAAHQPRPRSAPAVTWEPAIAAMFCVAYLSEVVRQALHLYGML